MLHAAWNIYRHASVLYGLLRHAQFDRTVRIWIMDALFVWIMLDRKFVIKEDLLEIKYGCFLHLHLRYEDIKEFHEIRRLTCLSKYAVDGVAIAFHPQNGRMGTDVIRIAPADLKRFLDHLKEKTMIA